MSVHSHGFDRATLARLYKSETNMPGGSFCKWEADAHPSGFWHVQIGWSRDVLCVWRVLLFGLRCLFPSSNADAYEKKAKYAASKMGSSFGE
jgi:hypothetical protein